MATSNILEVKIAIIVSGTPFVITVPEVFIEFFQTVEDYNFKTVSGSLFRLLRVASIFIVITLPSIYLTLIKFITPIVQSRIGIALTPFLEIMGKDKKLTYTPRCVSQFSSLKLYT
ncbi:spore germination protein [Clostridium sp. OS1-26]|uniref:spore germination protein n=1 Tax=Clostridium sp. OS1-26 TaxID=3070681 RepID=UPI0027E182CB|nr:spore germination protein [Clostridium sp. OS1-26]WML37044.1 spore germination protein [Clostridium sp. OS1-26]